MKYRVFKPENLSAGVHLPASKSISNRALILTALSGGEMSLLTNVSDCDDTRVMLRALARLEEERQHGFPTAEAPSTIDIGAAGTAMRFLTALLATTPGHHIITGTRRMEQRPISILVEALRELGADIDYMGRDGFPPLLIHGNTLHGGCLRLAGDVSSQYVSALLMISPRLSGNLRMELKGDIMSRPYIEMTFAMMRHFGVDAGWGEDMSINITPKPYTPTPFTIESDWSAASYWYETVLLGDQQQETATLLGLFPKSLQGDSAVANIFERLTVLTMPLGRDYSNPRSMLIRRGKMPQFLEWDFGATPDLAQTVVVACAMRGIAFRFTGLRSLRIKETDRIAALQTELAKLGVTVEVESDDIMRWDGPTAQRPAPVAYLQPAADAAIDTYNDHRMAMAFAPAAMILGHIDINDPAVVSKSYPRFWDDLRDAGFTIEEI